VTDNLCRVCREPLPESADDLGAWLHPGECEHVYHCELVPQLGFVGADALLDDVYDAVAAIRQEGLQL
jgi:hypothetical protein